MSKLKYNQFRKKDYLRILNVVVDFCLGKFGYKKRPYLLETRLGKGELMVFCNLNSHYAIFYDYEQFRKIFGKKNYETQEAYAMASAAHEMRHYYQVRQIFAKNPRESEKTIAEWRENHFNNKVLGEDGCTLLDFFLQPMELDAELYGYYFVAKILGCAIKLDYIDKDYISILKDKYIELHGEDDEDLYIFDYENQSV